MLAIAVTTEAWVFVVKNDGKQLHGKVQRILSCPEGSSFDLVGHTVGREEGDLHAFQCIYLDEVRSIGLSKG